MARSVARPVFWMAPCVWMASTALTWTPSPTWAGLVEPSVAVPALPSLSSWDRVSWKTTRLAL